MATDMGEYLVDAYLKLIRECDFVDYNVRPPVGGREGMAELDVVGLDFKTKTAYLCEVTTHLGGILYGKDNQTTLQVLRKKFERQQNYAARYLTDFCTHHYQFWAPYVQEGDITEELRKLQGWELVINANYAACVDALRQKARNTIRDIGNPFFRALQILEHLRS